MKKNALKGSLFLLLGAFIWGTAFVAQSIGSNDLNALSFNCIRNFIGVITLLPVMGWKLHSSKKSIKEVFTKKLLLGGLICGIALCVASNFQQMGIEQSTVGKSAFITALYIVLVPLMGLFFKKKVPAKVWLGVILATIGLYLLCMKNEALVLSTGDIYLLLCAFFFTIQITAIDYFAPNMDGVALSIVEFFVTGVLSGIGMLFTEVPSWSQISAAAIPLLYTGILSSGVAYTFQIIGQQHLSASVASLIMSLESVFATLAGWLILKEVLSTQELIGCSLVFAAVILSQIPITKEETDG